eukprot:CAMPEP_0196172040 /NCGR_PEP_ID=MMETSP0911-20130528/5858_1 /TAXON_ID=49265 /ORGANISM="Thalassiosira rotula, Strain GSO102" /LENGTH=108 /DNA_ID=CAMNT_0041438969 /DNA_START=11 /DNA_END=337 /DNA_ORIENTATION=+
MTDVSIRSNMEEFAIVVGQNGRRAVTKDEPIRLCVEGYASDTGQIAMSVPTKDAPPQRKVEEFDTGMGERASPRSIAMTGVPVGSCMEESALGMGHIARSVERGVIMR